MDVTNAKYLLDYVYHTRDDEQFRFYKKVSKFSNESILLRAHHKECNVYLNVPPTRF